MTPREYTKQKRGNRKLLWQAGIDMALVSNLIAGRRVTLRTAIDAARATNGQISVDEVVVSDEDRARLDFMKGKS